MWNPEIHLTASLVVFIVERERIGEGRKNSKERKEGHDERKKRKKAKILFNIS